MRKAFLALASGGTRQRHVATCRQRHELFERSLRGRSGRGREGGRKAPDGGRSCAAQELEAQMKKLYDDAFELANKRR
jgi:hypothetical protein